jgi:inorganic phosphate transporter, PiT family
MGVITAAMISYEAATTTRAQSFVVPTWVIVLSATVMALGTSFGGWRIIRTKWACAW